MNRRTELRGGIINKSTPIQSVSAGARVHCGEINSFVATSGFITIVLTPALLLLLGLFVTNCRPVELITGQCCGTSRTGFNICVMNSNVSRGVYVSIIKYEYNLHLELCSILELWQLSYLISRRQKGCRGGQRSRWTINPVIELSGDPTDTAVASRPGGLERSAFIVEKYLLHHLRSYSSLWCWWWRERPRPCGRSCQVTRSPPHPALPLLCLHLSHNLKGVNLSISFTNTALSSCMCLETS